MISFGFVGWWRKFLDSAPAFGATSTQSEASGKPATGAENSGRWTAFYYWSAGWVGGVLGALIAAWWMS